MAPCFRERRFQIVQEFSDGSIASLNEKRESVGQKTKSKH
jgi:hypothetical protein